MTYRYRLKELLLERNRKGGEKVTMKDVADAVGISRNHLYKMANSDGFPTKTEYIVSLCRFFNVGPEKVLEILPIEADQPEGPAGGDAGDGDVEGDA